MRAMRADWTVAMDDALTLRFRRCCMCMQAADRFEVWTDDHGEAAYLALCGPCLTRDVGGTRRDALLAAQVRQRREAQC
jgi:hypothetical protein